MIPQPFPGVHSTPSTAIPTESTTNMDVEDSFCKPSSFDSPDNLNMASKDSMLHQTLHHFDTRFFCPNDLSYSENAQFLRTQPTKNIVKPQIMHTHNKSYDFAYVNPPSPMFPYM